MQVWIACIQLSIHLAALRVISFTLCFLLQGFVLLGFEHSVCFSINFRQPLPALMNTFRFLALIKLFICPKHSDNTQPLISRIGSADRIEAGKLHEPRKDFSQYGIARMADVK